MLTGKAKEDFEYWLLTKGNKQIRDGDMVYDLYYMFKYMIPENMVCAKIIEWLDSVCIYASINYVKVISELEEKTGFEAKVTHDRLITEFRPLPDRQSAVKQAIERANKIYNER